MFAFYFGVSLFASAGIAAIAFGLFAVFEFFAIFLLTGISFDLGPIAYQSEYQLPNTSRAYGKKLVKLNCTQIKFIYPNFCIFSPRIRLFPSDLKFYWLAPLKGSVQLSGSSAKIIVRRAIGPFGFLLAWLMVWSVGSLMVAAASESASIDVYVFLLIGWIPCIALLFLEKWLSRKIGESTANEVLAYLSQEKPHSV
jgi:hypothetical protein